MKLTVIPILALGVTAITATAASADVNAREVWEAWKSMSGHVGQTLAAGSEDMDGNTLVLGDVTATSIQSEANATSRVEWIRLRERGDGTVEMTMSPDQRVVGSAEAEDGKPAEFDITLSYDDYRVLISGTPERMIHDYEIGRLGIDDASIEVEGEQAPLVLNFTLTSLAGQYIAENIGGPKLRLTGDGTADSMKVKINFVDPSKDSTLDMDIAATGIAATFSGDLVNMATVVNPFAAGGSYRFDSEVATMTSAVEVVEDGETVQVESVGKAGTFDLSAAAEELSYASDVESLDYTIRASEMPFPELKASIGRTAFKLLFPTAKTEEPRDFELLYSMRDLVIDERLWMMLDPGNALEHGPATLIVDLTGKARMLVDMMSNPHAMENLDGPPAELEELKLRKLQLTVGGAELTGDGAFTFDNSKTEMMNGFPQPDGAVDLKLVGGNALLDNLVKMGLVPEEQMMGVRMMMAMFTVPGQDADTVTSRIEVTPEGKILANGQPLN
ncbi:hypothetical protein DDZ14_09605 [Maritimibacter sp. 55A14]|uniref:DUF2125 domain-containing protein n=1 Tax=Maritimibacter sp. 55A14 TaxID=2174844 RepID=UPI000D606C00|nr:DUF2125 domain-containing protein [Maritimibacter sp. 55A14]PWE32637.1 hypothetical protein DDZ14_09605 [Maritimibacter sp. 55A14]